MKCFECEATEDLQEHHVVPRSRGGTKTITLCYSCHMKAHGRDGKGLHHKRLVSEGIARAKARGVRWGNPKLNEARKKSNEANRAKGERTVETYAPMIRKAQKAGCKTSREIAEHLNESGARSPRGKDVSHKLVLRCLEKMKPQENK